MSFRAKRRTCALCRRCLSASSLHGSFALLRMTRRFLAFTLNPVHKIIRFRPLCVILIRRRVKNRSVAVENEYRRNRQLPAFIAIGEGKIDERTAIDGFLQRWHAISQPKLPRDFVPSIGEQRESQLVLIVHEKRLLHSLRRNGNERRSRLLNLRQNEIHRLHLADAKRTPASADKAEHESSVGEQVRR